MHYLLSQCSWKVDSIVMNLCRPRFPDRSWELTSTIRSTSRMIIAARPLVCWIVFAWTSSCHHCILLDTCAESLHQFSPMGWQGVRRTYAFGRRSSSEVCPPGLVKTCRSTRAWELWSGLSASEPDFWLFIAIREFGLMKEYWFFCKYLNRPFLYLVSNPISRII